MIVCLLLIKFILVRRRQLNEFEETKNNRTREENFEIVLKGLKKLNVVEIDRDLHNWTINAKYKSSLVAPAAEWLTIICLDACILVEFKADTYNHAVMDEKECNDRFQTTGVKKFFSLHCKLPPK